MSHKKLKEIELLFEVSSRLTISELIEKSSIPRATIKRYLNRLIAENKIKPHGKGRGRYYQIKEQIRDSRVAVLKSGSLIGYLSYQEGRYGFEYDKSYRPKRVPRGLWIFLWRSFQNILS